MDVLRYNRESWNEQVKMGNQWTRCVSEATIAKAREGDWSIVLTPFRPVPRSWFPVNLEGQRILCLASAGGQQAPILAAAGAEVTLLDNSPKQLEQDEFVAERDGLAITVELGDMRDLSRFEAESFDLVVHPLSNVFVESVLPVWKEAARILHSGGSLLSGFANPVVFIFDLKAWKQGELAVRHSIPYSDLRDLESEELQTLVIDRKEPLCFGHTLHDLIQGQIETGFHIAGFYEDDFGDGPLDDYLKSTIATRAIRPRL